MKFCPVCDYMMYVDSRYDKNKEDGEPEENMMLKYMCHNCGYHIDSDKEESVLVSDTYRSKHNESAYMVINKNIVHDPTIPHVNNIRCPNEGCKSNTDSSVERDVMFVKYDNTNVLYAYYCTHCNHSWKN